MSGGSGRRLAREITSDESIQITFQTHACLGIRIDVPMREEQLDYHGMTRLRRPHQRRENALNAQL